MEDEELKDVLDENGLVDCFMLFPENNGDMAKIMKFANKNNMKIKYHYVSKELLKEEPMDNDDMKMNFDSEELPKERYNILNGSIPLTEEEIQSLKQKAIETEKFYKKKYNIKD